MTIGTYIRGGFGYTAHTLQDIHRIMTGSPDIEEGILISAKVSGYDIIVCSSNEGVTAWVARRVIGDVERPDNDVWQVSHVVAHTEQDLNDFVERLEALEAKRAKQILGSWRGLGWPTDYLETLSNRQIVVVDATIDATIQARSTLEHVRLTSAFDGEGHTITWTDQRTHRDDLPVAKCIEYIAGRIGPYEFVSFEAALLTRDMWAVLNHDSSMTECMVAGLTEMGHVRLLPDWTGWGDT